MSAPHPAGITSREKRIADWLSSYGLSFNPFSFAESERDRRPEAYYVEHPAFEVARSVQHAIVYANPGGGKTATRLRLESYYRNFFPIDHIFGVPHVIQDAAGGAPPHTLDQHLSNILASAVQNAFLLLAQYGDRLPGLRAPGVARRLPVFFDACYPTRAWRDDLADAGRAGSLQQALNSLGLPYEDDSPPALRGSVSPEWIHDWLAMLGPEQPKSAGNGSAAVGRAAWLEFRQLMLTAGASAIVILVDGVDAGAGRAPLAGMLTVIKPLLRAMADGSMGEWVYIKLFLPLVMRGSVQPCLQDSIGEHIITWQDPGLLRNLLGRRLSTASDGAVQSFAQLVESDVDHRALEDRLLEAANGSPRHLINLVNRFFALHVGDGVASRERGRVARRTVEAFVRELQESDVTT